MDMEKSTVDNAVAIDAVQTSHSQRRMQAASIMMLALCAFILLFVWASWDQWRSLQSYEVVRVIGHQQQTEIVLEHTEEEGDEKIYQNPSHHGKKELAFQAAGWVEADPLTIQITALVSGVVENVMVTDGQSLQKDA
ncbi:MAG: hypothetical protein HRU15_08860, partial [Planctomycetes bacterium]|nr:hypothetical protein [Planctomycetota bacterium]